MLQKLCKNKVPEPQLCLKWWSPSITESGEVYWLKRFGSSSKLNAIALHEGGGRSTNCVSEWGPVSHLQWPSYGIARPGSLVSHAIGIIVWPWVNGNFCEANGNVYLLCLMIVYIVYILSLKCVHTVQACCISDHFIMLYIYEFVKRYHI